MGKSLQGGRLVSNSRIFVDSGGNIGIGSTQPTSKFDITGDVKITGISTFNSNIGVTGHTETDTLRVSGVSTLSNVVVGGATTELVVNGDARVTGILTVGTASLTLNGTTGAITGGSLTNAQVAAISSEISDTAVDVFVYDTRKDSDGGAWRKRTQHTSWYNETLNTQYRGSRREFPAVAVIVAEEFDITIYDGDDPDLPMWMLLRRNGWDRLAHWSRADDTSTAYESLAALNGIICVGSHSDESSLQVANFVSDKSEIYRGTGNNYSHGYNPGLVGDTGASDNGSIFDGTATGLSIVNSIVNDVAMTVLPNAQIDSATGLPVPTIAVATDGGVSIIKDDGTVVDIAEVSAAWSSNLVEFFDGKLIHNDHLTGTNSEDYLIVSDIPASDTNYLAGGVNYNHASTPKIVYSRTHDNTKLVSLINNTFALGSVDSTNHLTLLSHETTQSQSMVAFATTSYNTGWMHGDIKGAFLSDTDTTNVSAVVVNSSTSDWSQQGTYNWTITSATEITVSSVTSGQSAVLRLTTDSSKHYVYSFNVTSVSDNVTFRDDQNDEIEDPIPSSTGVYTGSFTGTSYVDFTVYQNDSATITDIDIREAEEDRSVNNNGLAVYGTITKSAVATGAELVAYSGFSDSTNYLKQPYNANMNFGTGDFSIMGWINISSLPGSGSLVFVSQHNGVDSSGNRWAFYVLSSGSNLGFYQDDGFNSTNTTNGPSITTGVWQHVTVVRRGSANQVAFYVNGELLAQTATTRDVDNTGNITTVGVDHSFGSAADNTSISLLRISKSEPSAEQIKKMYEDEKMLFQENAKCTLYGSSDAVTALAYDDSTNLLYAGTSSGRSDFQGLRRINNTTTAVTTAISAQDEFIVEQ